MADGGSIYGRAAALLDLPPATARDASESLKGRGMLHRRGEKLEIVDPLFADWLRRRFPLSL